MTTVAQSVYTSVAHRYWRSDWSVQKNREVYATDASAEGLGANMRLELEAELAESQVSALLNQLKIQLDHECLFMLPGSRFATEASTLENITRELESTLKTPGWRTLTVWESPNLGCRVSSDGQMVLIFKRRNLTLEIAAQVNEESGLAVSRALVANSVEDLLVKLNAINDPDTKAWGRKLFAALQVALPGLISVRVDLGRHEGIVVHSGS